MSNVEELLRKEADGTLSFGNYSLNEKKKVEGFKAGNDVLKVKTFNEITRLEKNDMMIYESVPGTAVSAFEETDNGVSFKVSAPNDVEITLGLAEGTEYSVSINGTDNGKMKTNMSGKLTISVATSGASEVEVKVTK